MSTATKVRQRRPRGGGSHPVTAFRVPADELARLDERVTVEGSSRSDVLRAALAAYLTDDDRKARSTRL